MNVAELARADIKVLESVGCQFWACPGPDEAPVDMATCHVCWRIRELRELAEREDAKRDQIVDLWNRLDGWIPGAAYKDLAAVLGIDPEALLESRRKRDKAAE